MTIFDIIAEGPVVFADETTGYVFNIRNQVGTQFLRVYELKDGVYVRNPVARFLDPDFTLDDAHEAAEDWFTDLTCSEAA